MRQTKKKKTKTYGNIKHSINHLLILFLIPTLLSSCGINIKDSSEVMDEASSETNNKVTCDRVSGISLLKKNIMQKYTEELALRIASDNYEGNKFNKEIYRNSYSGAFIRYLQAATQDVINGESEYYHRAAEIIESDNFFSIRHIITEAYDEQVNKCSCKATVNYADGSLSTDIEYSFMIDNENYIHAQYFAPTNITFEKFDDITNNRVINDLLKSLEEARELRKR